MNSYVEATREVADEIVRQDVKWGQQDHADEIWLTVLSEEVGEAAKAILEMRFARSEGCSTEDEEVHLRSEVVQIAAVAMQWLMAMRRV